MIKNRVYVLLSLISVVVIVSFYIFFIIIPINDVITKNIENEYISRMKMKSILFDNTISKYIQGAESLSSRSTIKKKIVEFNLGKISFRGLKNFTSPLYKDGLKPIKNLIFVARYIKDKPLIERGNSDLFKRIFKDMRFSDDTVVKFFTIKNSDCYTYVLSPVKKNKEILGYDILLFTNKNIIKHMQNNGIIFQIFNNNGHGYYLSKKEKLAYIKDDYFFKNGYKASYQIKSKYADIFYKFNFPKKVLYKELYIYYKFQGIVLVLFFTAIFLILFTLNRRTKILYLQKVLESERKYRMMIDALRDAIVIMRENKLLFVNKASSILLGYSKDEMMEMDVRKFYKIEEFESNQNKFEKVLIKKDGTEVDVEITRKQIQFGESRSEFIIIRDITEQKKMIETIKRSVSRGNGLSDFIPICAGCSKIHYVEKSGSPWVSPADYLSERLRNVKFSHTMCPECVNKWYPDFKIDE